TFDGMIAIEGLLAPETGAVIKAALATLERRLLREDVQEAKACEAATRDDTPAPTSADAEQLMPSASAPPPPAAGASGAGDVADGVPSLDPEVDPDLDQGTLRLRRTAGQRRADALAEL